MKKKVVIIGAGPAGLTAANELLQNGNYDVMILEEKYQVGGISKTINYNGNRMDIGGHRFFTKDVRILNYWKELLSPQGKPAYDDLKLNIEKDFKDGQADPEKEDKVFLLRRRVSRILYNGKFFDYPISFKFSTFKNLGLLMTIKAGFSYIYSCIFKMKEDSLENFYINRFGKVLYECFFKDYTEKVWGKSPKEISADWGKQRVKGISVIKVIKSSLHLEKDKEASLIEEFYYPKFGPGQMWETLEEKVIEKGGLIQKGFKVNKLNFENGRIISVEGEIDGVVQKIEADLFISSMPIVDLVNSFNVDVPDEVIKITNGLPYRDFITVGVLAKKLELKNKTNMKTINNIVPDCWIYVQEKDVKVGRMQIFNNWSPYLVKDIDNTIWVGLEYFVRENDDLWNMSDEDFSQFALSELEKINVIKKENVIDLHVERVKKAYPAYFDTYDNIEEVKKYLNSIENLYCIGRNGQHRYNNMDHSMLTAIECTDNIINGVSDRTNIWNVNTEKEYHETK